MIRSPISCSSLHRRKLCPGSAAAEAACPEVHTADSDMGTRLHGIMALLRDPDRWRGIADADRLVCERADSLRDESLAALEAEHGLVGTEYVESFEVEIFIEVGGNRIPGHIDYLRWYPEARILVIFDYKFGTNPVERTKSIPEPEKSTPGSSSRAFPGRNRSTLRSTAPTRSPSLTSKSGPSIGRPAHQMPLASPPWPPAGIAAPRQDAIRVMIWSSRRGRNWPRSRTSTPCRWK